MAEIYIILIGVILIVSFVVALKDLYDKIDAVEKSLGDLANQLGYRQVAKQVTYTLNEYGWSKEPRHKGGRR